MEKERREPIQPQGLVLSKRSKMPPHLHSGYRMSQGFILLFKNMIHRLGPLEWGTPIQGRSPTWYEELEYLLLDFNTILPHFAIALPQLPNAVGRPLDYRQLMKVSSILITLFDLLNLGLLPSHYLLLSQQRVVHRELMMKHPQVRLIEAPLLIMSLLELCNVYFHPLNVLKNIANLMTVPLKEPVPYQLKPWGHLIPRTSTDWHPPNLPN